MGTKSNRSSGTQLTQRGVNQGNVLVDPVSGLPIDVIEDASHIRRLAVDANLTADNVIVDTRPLDASTDNVAIKDPSSGNILKIESDGSIDVNVVGKDVGTYRSIFDEVSSVVSGSPTNISTYTVPPSKLGFLQKVEVSGDNIATYDVIVNSVTQDRKRTYFGGDLNSTFDFSDFDELGYPLSSGDQIIIQVVHNRPDPGNFNSRIQVIEV